MKLPRIILLTWLVVSPTTTAFTPHSQQRRGFKRASHRLYDTSVSDFWSSIAATAISPNEAILTTVSLASVSALVGAANAGLAARESQRQSEMKDRLESQQADLGKFQKSVENLNRLAQILTATGTLSAAYVLLNIVPLVDQSSKLPPASTQVLAEKRAAVRSANKPSSTIDDLKLPVNQKFDALIKDYSPTKTSSEQADWIKEKEDKMNALLEQKREQLLAESDVVMKSASTVTVASGSGEVKADASKEVKKEEGVKAEVKKEEPKKTEDVKSEIKKIDEVKKEEPTVKKTEDATKKEEVKADAKKEEVKKDEGKSEVKKDEAKKEEVKADAKKEEPKKEQPKVEAKKEEPKKEGTKAAASSEDNLMDKLMNRVDEVKPKEPEIIVQAEKRSEEPVAKDVQAEKKETSDAPKKELPAVEKTDTPVAEKKEASGEKVAAPVPSSPPPTAPVKVSAPVASVEVRKQVVDAEPATAIGPLFKSAMKNVDAVFTGIGRTTSSLARQVTKLLPQDVAKEFDKVNDKDVGIFTSVAFLATTVGGFVIAATRDDEPDSKKHKNGKQKTGENGFSRNNGKSPSLYNLEIDSGAGTVKDSSTTVGESPRSRSDETERRSHQGKPSDLPLPNGASRTRPPDSRWMSIAPKEQQPVYLSQTNQGDPPFGSSGRDTTTAESSASRSTDTRSHQRNPRTSLRQRIRVGRR